MVANSDNQSPAIKTPEGRKKIAKKINHSKHLTFYNFEQCGTTIASFPGKGLVNHAQTTEAMKSIVI